MRKILIKHIGVAAPDRYLVVFRHGCERYMTGEQLRRLLGVRR
jgi:hypothetical protein